MDFVSWAIEKAFWRGILKVTKTLRQKALAVIEKRIVVEKGWMSMQTAYAVPWPSFQIRFMNKQPVPVRVRSATISIFLGGQFVLKHMWNREESQSEERRKEGKAFESFSDLNKRKDGSLEDGSLILHIPIPLYIYAFFLRGWCNWELVGYVRFESDYGMFDKQVGLTYPTEERLAQDATKKVLETFPHLSEILTKKAA